MAPMVVLGVKFSCNFRYTLTKAFGSFNVACWRHDIGAGFLVGLCHQSGIAADAVDIIDAGDVGAV